MAGSSEEKFWPGARRSRLSEGEWLTAWLFHGQTVQDQHRPDREQSIAEPVGRMDRTARCRTDRCQERADRAVAIGSRGGQSLVDQTARTLVEREAFNLLELQAEEAPWLEDPYMEKLTY